MQIKEENRQDKCTCIIPEKVENKIRTLLKEVYNTEWSGILFYEFICNEEEKITVTCKDILLMDIGSVAFTTFDMNSEVISYMTENDLIDCNTALIHSHHSMSTTPSGTDINTLEQEGKDMDNFFSLIVNNEGTYTAMITWKDKVTISGNRTFFGKLFNFNSQKEVELLRYSKMKVEKPTITEDKELLDRIKFIKEKKAKEKEESAKKQIIKGTAQELPFSLVSKSYAGCNDWRDDFSPYKWESNDKEKSLSLPAYKKEEQKVTKPESQMSYKDDDEDMYDIELDVINDAITKLIHLDLLYEDFVESEDFLKSEKEGMAHMYNMNFKGLTDTTVDYILDSFTESVLYLCASKSNFPDKVTQKMENLAFNLLMCLSEYTDKKLPYINRILTIIRENYGM